VNTISADEDLKGRISDVVGLLIILCSCEPSNTALRQLSSLIVESFMNSIHTTTIVTVEMVKAVLVEKCTVTAYRLSINVFSAG
jgi:hypothetical protein